VGRYTEGWTFYSDIVTTEYQYARFRPTFRAPNLNLWPPPLPVIDLNADLGEGFGSYRLGDDRALLALVTSANIACGFHAGDPLTMRETVAVAAANGVAIGAHPGYPDLLGFGRRELAATPAEITAYVIYQVGALQAVCHAAGTRLRYVKAHGALYNRAVADRAAADAIATGVRSVDPDLSLLGLAGSELLAAARAAGLRAASETFADRAYARDGSLVPRSEPGAVLRDVDAVVARAIRLVTTGRVTSIDGHELQLQAHSLCVHGDTPGALSLLRALRQELTSVGVTIAPFAS
jgi:5-oxoprolinase (ATP-hydrolysing) subunit A